MTKETEVTQPEVTKPEVKEAEVELTFREVKTINDLFCQFDDKNGVLLLDVKKPFTADDFENIDAIVEPYYKEHGELKGVIINSPKFPYWSDAKNRAQYLAFARNNHEKFKKAALGMNGFFVKIVARIARGRVHPQLKLFKYNEIAEAQSWILYSK